MKPIALAIAFVFIAGCAVSSARVATTSSNSLSAAGESISPACASPEHRQFDFWIGDWDVVLHARQAPDVDRWEEARGTQRIESILGGCAISEHFRAEGPGTAWAGKSYSSWQPARRVWRQTWVDDQGGYLAFVGGVERGAMTLMGEPTQKEGVTVQMRMVFLDVTAQSMRWEWQRTTDGGATWSPQLIIDYRRAAR